jgi:dTDP-4-dehydrorhamnose 3,5-epimerase/reductase
VFNGIAKVHNEDESFSPLSVYGQTKAAGDIAAGVAPRHYVIRTGWVIGDGKNFVSTMKNLAERGLQPQVVNDQIGRLTFTEDLSAAVKFLLESRAPYGTYNMTNDGEPASWADFAKIVFEASGRSADDVEGVSTEAYYADKPELAPRPLQSTLNIAKIQSAGFAPRKWDTALREYLEQQHS